MSTPPSAFRRSRADGRFIRVNEAICAITGYSREHLLANRLFGHSHPDDTEPDRQAFRKQVAGELDFYSIEKRLVRRDGRVIWISVRSSPVRDADGRLLYVVRVVQDITEFKAAERRQKLLIDELNHRVKNTLATVQSLASQTARAAPTPAAFRAGFEGRLIALSQAHDQLTKHRWESADLRALLSASFAPYSAGPERIVLRGEDLVLRPRAVLTLAMTFHELITNAAKYGALSTPAGRIEIRWQPVVAPDGPATLRIEWQEQDGPPVARAQPARLRLAAHRRRRRRRARRQRPAHLRAGGLALHLRHPAGRGQARHRTRIRRRGGLVDLRGLFRPSSPCGLRRKPWLAAPANRRLRLRRWLANRSSRSERRLVEPRGIEPLTSSLRTRRSPS